MLRLLPSTALTRNLLAAVLMIVAVVCVLASTPNTAHAESSEALVGPYRTAASNIATGNLHTCMITASGSVQCWGNNDYGQLGLGNTDLIGDNEQPSSIGIVSLGAGRTASAITAGMSHTCVLLDNGAVRCWGRGYSGQLGLGNGTNIGDNELPSTVGTVPLGAGRTATAISAGDAHTCAVLDNGSVRCWGDSGSGQLGLGNTNPIGDDEPADSVGTVSLGAGRTATSISAGSNHSCAILDNGTARCWGGGSNGQLGLGTTDSIGDDELPDSVAPVSLGAGRTATAISGGAFHSCVVLDNGTARCWGFGGGGQLGLGNTSQIGDDEQPDSVPAIDLGAGRTATSISAGSNHTCVILDNSATRCWGSGTYYGQLGLGSMDTIGDDEQPDSVPTVSLGAGRTATAISTGEIHTCAVLDDGTVRCWGSSGYGQLGLGTSVGAIGDNEHPDSVSTVSIGAGRTASSIASADSHSCVLLDDGTVRCWGDGSDGKLGNGGNNTVGDDELPSSVSTVSLGAGRTATAIAAGGAHTCALLDNGAVRCWGSNWTGQLGLGNTVYIGDNEQPDTVAPVSLGAGRTATAITAGSLHTCALLDNGEVRCWGYNGSGQLGLGNSDSIGDDEVPDTVGTISLGAGRTAIAITAGGSHTCAVLDNGTVRCWGTGGNGQLGLGNTNTIGDNELPSSVGTVSLGVGRTAITISAGENHTCVVLDDDSLRCWGYNDSGQLGLGSINTIGDGELPDSVPPVSLGAGRTAVSVTAGYAYTCAVLDNGDLRCWGDNGQGQLGLGNTDIIGDNELPDTVGPISLGAGRTSLSVSAGSSHTCSILDNGTLRCWGAGWGPLGLGLWWNLVGDDDLPSAFPVVDVNLPSPLVVLESTLSGDADPTLNATLECGSSSWWYSSGITYQWKRDGNPIAGATGDTYDVATADDGTTLTCDVIASNADGSTTLASTGSRTANTPPSQPTLSVSSHIAGAGWSKGAQLNATWTGATDAHGVTGYAVSTSASAAGDPGTTITTTQTSDSITPGDGTWYVHVRAQDSTGRWNQPVHLGPYSIDSTAPRLDSFNSAVTNTSASWSVQAADSGSGLAAKPYRYTVMNGPIGQTGLWTSSSTHTLGSLLPASSKTVKVQLTDQAGNLSPVYSSTATTTGTADTTAPKITLKSGTATNGSSTFAAANTVKFAITDTGVGVQTTQAFLGTKELTIDASGNLDTRTLPEGKNKLSIIATDLAGNTQTQLINLTIDRTAPTLRSWTRHTAGPKARAAFTDRGGIGVARTTQLSALTMGNNRVRVRVTDRLGNSRTVTLPIKRHISLSKPWLNDDAHKTLGYHADASTIREAFRFVGYTEPWYAFAQQSHPLITEVQHRLRIVGTAPSLRPTGKLDIPTLLAIRKFQRQNGISDIATVGPKTRKALDRKLDRHLQNQG